MGLNRLDLPKSTRENIEGDLGVDDYKGTPEKFNTDAIIPVYQVGETKGNRILRSYVYDQTFDLSGLTDLTIPIWQTAPAPGVIVPEVMTIGLNHYVCLPWGRFQISFDAAGRAAMAAASCPHWMKIFFQPVAPDGGGFDICEWLWRPEASAGIGLYDEGWIQSHTSARAGLASTPLNSERPVMNPIWHDRRGPILHGNAGGDWFFSCGIDTRYVAVFPANTSLRMYIYAEVHRSYDVWPVIV